MKINEVETLAGITKKNIRFYEEQGLLCPKRNADNGYREYGEADVQILRRIRLLRKLGVPIEEIRQMFDGIHTVGDGMRRHLVSLEREQRNLEQSIALCRELQNREIPIVQLETDEILRRMEEMEQRGTSFRDKHTGDERSSYIAPIVITVGVVTFMIGLCALLIWAFTVSPEEAPPMWFLWLLVGVFIAIAIGTVLALLQRIREIRKGEMEDAKYY